MACVVFLCAIAGVALARQAAAPKAPGKYRDWGPEIDQIEIMAPFRLADFADVQIEPLATDSVHLPEPGDNTYKPVIEMLPRVGEELAVSLRGRLKQQVAVGAVEKPAAGMLILRGKVTLLDPGSKAARYWGGFGAGAVKLEVHCEIVDGGSGNVLAAFTQQRRSGFGAFGGGYTDLMLRTTHQIGDDIANLLHQF